MDSPTIKYTRMKSRRNESRINWSHPLVRGMIRCWIMNEGAGPPQDYLYKAAPTVVGGGAPSWVSGNQGIGTYFNGTSDYYTSGTRLLGVTNQLTVVAKIKPVYIDATLPRIIYSRSGTVYPVAFSIEPASSTSATTRFSIRTTITGTGVTVGASRNYNIIYSVVAGTFDGSYRRVYHNGILDTTSTPAMTGVLDENGAQPETIGSNHTPAWFWSGFIEFIYLWNRALATDELQWLAQEPYSFLLPVISKKSYFFSTAAAGTVYGVLDGILEGSCVK